MKKKIFAILTACACSFTGLAAFTGCGLFGGSEYELVSATIIADSPYTRNWAYIDSDKIEDVVQYPRTLGYELNVTVKDGKGKEMTGEIGVAPWSTTASLRIDNSLHDYLSVAINVTGYDDSQIGFDKALTIKLTPAADSSIKTGEVELNTTYSVVHAFKKIEIDESIKTDYALNEEYQQIPMKVTYEDDSTEVLDFDELIALPQYEENSSVSGFDSSSLGAHKPLSVSYQTSATGNRSTTLYYNVLPDASWEKGSSNTGNERTNYEYYKTADMTFSKTVVNDYYMDKTSFGSVNILSWVTSGAIIPGTNTETVLENAMNSTSDSNAFFHAPIPAGQTVKVNKATKTTKQYIVDYDCYENTTKVSSNKLYLIYDSNPNKLLSVTLENVDTLSADELAKATDFVNLLWFK